MSICALWIISLAEKRQRSVLFSKHYPTVKKRARKSNSLHCALLPDNEQVSESIITEMQVKRTSEEFIKEYDSCTMQRNPPIYSILESKVWPIIAIVKHGLVFACLPYVEHSQEELFKMNYKTLGPIAVAYSMMHKIADLIGPIQPGLEVSEEKIQDLRDYLLVCMPFGTPLEMDPATSRGILNSKDSLFVPKQKVPSWRPNTFKGKQHIAIFIHEQLRCVQYDRSSMPDVCEVFGTISCKAELEGSPEVSLDLLATNDSTVFDNMICHYCVQQSDSLTPTITAEDKTFSNPCGVRSLRFCPPIDSFVLCQYKLTSAADCLPIMAYYQMKIDGNKAQFKIQLNLWKTMKNNFEYLHVMIPFFNRTPITKFECTPTSHNVVLLKDLRTLRWNIGSKFPSKTLDLSLEGRVWFSEKGEAVTMADSFCVGPNSYILISFKVADYTYSGLRLDNRSISLDSNSKFKVTAGAEFLATEFRVWNSLGDAIGYGMNDNTR